MKIQSKFHSFYAFFFKDFSFHIQDLRVYSCIYFVVTDTSCYILFHFLHKVHYTINSQSALAHGLTGFHVQGKSVGRL
jgi:hypothetical protein